MGSFFTSLRSLNLGGGGGGGGMVNPGGKGGGVSSAIVNRPLVVLTADSKRV